jgi:hypothetical protein
MMTTNQKKLRQSCREYRAIKAGDLVSPLRMTRKRQMQRRNKINHATSAQHAPHTSYSTKPKSGMMKTHQTNIRQSCREYHAIKAGDLVALLRRTRKRQMQSRNKSRKHFPYTRRNRMRSGSARRRLALN